MTTIEEQFLELIHLSPETQDERLDEMDEDTRREVAEMLRHFEVANKIQGLDAEERNDDSIDDGIDKPVPERIGEFTIQERIGSGGMGDVYRANQSRPVQREVAVKLLRAFSTKEQRQRFESEAQALAMMDHPNIANILSAGITDDGQAYLVMEFIPDAVAIHEYCNQQRLSLEQRMHLFSAIAQGVQHAHRRSVLHRDLKPANVIISTNSDQPVPKIIDFGLAKSIDESTKLSTDTLSTSVGQVMGTLEYMSPEQAEMGDHPTDTRTDVYGLGAILHELLCGQPPLPKPDGPESMLDKLNRIRGQERDRPSEILSRSNARDDGAVSGIGDQQSVHKRLTQSLDWISKKALHLDPDQRYQSVDELLRDVDRYLKGDPLQARPDSFVYRAKCFVGKHKRAIVTVVLAASLLAAIVSAAKYAVDANASRKDAEIATEKSGIARELADNAAADAELQTAVALSSMKDHLKTLRMTARSTPGGAKIAQEMTLSIAKKLAAIDKRYVDNSQVDIATARSFLELGDFTIEFGDLMESNPMDTQGIGAETMAVTDIAKAESYYSRAFDICHELKSSPETRNSDSVATYASCLRRLGDVARRSSRLDEANRRYQDADELFSALQRDKQLRQYGLGELSINRSRLADVAMMRGDLDAAESFYDSLLQSAGNASGASKVNWAVFAKLGQIEQKKGMHSEAISHYEQALAVARQEVKANPADIRSQIQLADSLALLGNAKIDFADELASGIKMLEEAIELHQKILTIAPDELFVAANMANTLDMLSGANQRVNRHQDAVENLRLAIVVRRQLVQRSGDVLFKIDLVSNANELAKLALVHGQIEPAIEYSAEAIRNLSAIEHVAGDQTKFHEAAARAYMNAANLHLENKEFQKAMDAVEKARESIEFIFDKTRSHRDELKILICEHRLGLILTSAKRHRAAEALLRKTRDRSSNLVKEHPDDMLVAQRHADLLSLLAGAELRVGDYDKALATYAESMAISDRLIDANPDSSDRVEARVALVANIGSVHLEARNLKQAQENLADAERQYKQLADSANRGDLQWRRCFCLLRLGRSFLYDNRPAEASEQLQKALELGEKLTANGTSSSANEEILQELQLLNELAHHFRDAMDDPKTIDALPENTRFAMMALRSVALECAGKFAEAGATAMMYADTTNRQQDVLLCARTLSTAALNSKDDQRAKVWVAKAVELIEKFPPKPEIVGQADYFAPVREATASNEATPKD